MSLLGKTALVTGSSRGMGLAIAKELSRRGSSVVLMARDEQLLRYNVENELYAGDHSYISCDLTDLGNLKECARDVSCTVIERSNHRIIWR
jgi:3-oxoacyl-[acyl-carrier protein] reductase